jgi:hypothetical protein
MPIDYSKGKIYKLTTIHDPELVYYGSTINILCKRKQEHKYKFKKGILDCSSNKLFELGIDDVEITLVESVNCNNKEELLKKERFYIENNNCVNKNIPNRNFKEYIKYYRKENKDKIKKKNKEYREKTKEQRDEYNKNYYEQNKNDIKMKRKIYREQNKKK